MSGPCRKPFHLPRSFVLTQGQKNHGINYHHYYFPAPSRGLWATEGRMCDASGSEAKCTRGPEGIHLILCQVHIAPRPEQLQEV
jgi:hypothetical protein